jgi:hypothetical protein
MKYERPFLSVSFVSKMVFVGLLPLFSTFYNMRAQIHDYSEPWRVVTLQVLLQPCILYIEV